jgi:hypothetical protein
MPVSAVFTVVTFACASIAAASLRCRLPPEMMHGAGNPEIAALGDMPTSPLTVLVPMQALAAPEPPRTPKLAAAPKPIVKEAAALVADTR